MSRGAKGRASQLRIIGGEWRGRKLAFTPAPGLRPTGDRVRETLFNWLAADTPRARCLDLFAGSGALGLEALSRGAAHCDFVDTSGRALADIDRHLQILEAGSRGRCHKLSATDFIARAAAPWDIVFIDPPFGQQLVAPVCEQLGRGDQLADQALVYVEMGRDEEEPEWPGSWELHRAKQAGDVVYRLFVVAPRQNV